MRFKAFVVVVAIGVMGCSSVRERVPQRVPSSQAQEQQNAQILLERQFLRQLASRVEIAVDANRFFLEHLYACTLYYKQKSMPPVEYSEYLLREVPDAIAASRINLQLKEYSKKEENALKKQCPALFLHVVQMVQKVLPAIKESLTVYSVLKKQSMDQLFDLMLRQLQYEFFKKTGHKLQYAYASTSSHYGEPPLHATPSMKWMQKEYKVETFQNPKKLVLESLDFSLPLKAGSLSGVAGHTDAFAPFDAFYGIGSGEIASYVKHVAFTDNKPTPQSTAIRLGDGEDAFTLEGVLSEHAYAPKAIKEYYKRFNDALFNGQHSGGKSVSCESYHEALFDFSERLTTYKPRASEPKRATADTAQAREKSRKEAQAHCVGDEESVYADLYLSKANNQVKKSIELWDNLELQYDSSEVDASKHKYIFRFEFSKLSKLSKAELKKLYLAAAVLRHFSRQSLDSIMQAGERDASPTSLKGWWWYKFYHAKLASLVQGAPFLAMLKPATLQQLAVWQDHSNWKGLDPSAWRDMERVFFTMRYKGQKFYSRVKGDIKTLDKNLMQFGALVDSVAENGGPRDFLQDTDITQVVEELKAQYESKISNREIRAGLVLLGACLAPLVWGAAGKLPILGKVVQRLRAAPKLMALKPKGLVKDLLLCGLSFDLAVFVGWSAFVAHNRAMVFSSFLSQGIVINDKGNVENATLTKYADFSEAQKEIFWETVFELVGFFSIKSTSKDLMRRLGENLSKGATP